MNIRILITLLFGVTLFCSCQPKQLPVNSLAGRVTEGGDEVKELVKLDVNPKDWQPYDVVKKDYKVLTHTLEGVAETAGLAGKYKVGIWMPEVASNLKYNADYAVKFAVSEQMTPWSDDAGRYAVNIVGEISF